MFNHAQESKKVSREKVVAVVAELKAMKLPETVKKVETGIEENQTYCDFPSEHWVKIQTNDVIERMLRDIRCRIHVVGALLDSNSALMLVCVRLRRTAETQWGARSTLTQSIRQPWNKRDTVRLIEVEPQKFMSKMSSYLPLDSLIPSHL